MTATFHIVPAGAKPLYILLPVLVVLIGAIVMLGMAVYGSSNATFEFSPSGLRLRGDIYAREIPAATLRGGAARLIDLNAEPDLLPRGRTFGTGLPGYWAGWFKLRNGEKALLFVTDRSRVVYVPTLEDYSVLLSVTEPNALLARLREIAPRT